MFAAELGEPVEDALALDALGDHATGRGCGPGRWSSARSPRRPDPRPCASTNDLSILIASTGKLLQVGERGVARAEVVDRERDAHLREPVEHRLGAPRLGHDHALGDLQLEPLGIEVPLRSAGASTSSGRWRSSRFCIDRLTATVELEALVVPRAALAQRLLQRCREVSGLIRLGVLGERHELVRGRAGRAGDGPSARGPRRPSPCPWPGRSSAGSRAPARPRRSRGAARRPARGGRGCTGAGPRSRTRSPLCAFFATYIATSARWISSLDPLAVLRAQGDADAGLRPPARGRRPRTAPRRP